MDFKNLLFSFDGRIGRQSWWIGQIILNVLGWIVMMLMGVVFGTSMMAGMDPNMPAEPSAAAMMPFVIVSLIFLWPSLAILAKRWHDRGKSGWWTLIGLVPFIGWLWILIECGFLRGTDGPNQYGADPIAG